MVHTPGHTPEHLTFLITDGAVADRPIAAATGDFIFAGDVGRPDLLEKAAKIRGTMETGARTLWQSLQAFRQRDEWLQLWPGHGAGSACGKGISALPQTTLGYELRFNWAFQAATEDEFVRQVLAGQPDPPKYFAAMKAVNKAGPALLGGVAPPPRWEDRRLPELLAQGALVVDTRAADAYAARHVPGTLNLPLNGSFVTWAGWLLPYDTDIHLIVDEAAAARTGEVVRLLALIGLDRVAGYVGESAVAAAEAHGATMGSIPQMTIDQLAALLPARGAAVIDVRSASEWAEGHLPGARHIPLGELADRIGEVPHDAPVVVHCQLGGRSAIAASLLRRLGHPNVTNLAGGYAAWHRARHPFEKGEAHAPASAHA